MRARNIKPGFFKNEILGEMQPLARLLFIGLWCMADKDGRLEDRPKRIKAEVLPYDDILAGGNNGELTVKSRLSNGDLTVTSLLDNLQAAGFIKRYSVKGQKLIQVENFQKHQSPHHTEKGLGFPGPEAADITGEKSDNGCVTVNSRLEHGENPPDSLIHGFTDSLIEDSLISAPDSPGGEPEADATVTVTGPAKKIDPVFICIPTNKFGTDKEEFQVCESFVSELIELFPGIDVRQELRAIRAWNLTNKARRKTLGGVPAHISSWLARQQNRGSRGGNGKRSGVIVSEITEHNREAMAALKEREKMMGGDYEQ